MTRLGPTKAVVLGTGVRAAATVEAREGEGAWHDCAYSAVAGS